MKQLEWPQDFLRKLLRVSEFFGLTVVGISTTLAMANETWKMISTRLVTLTDLLLMFLFLEVLAMVKQYFRSGELPVRFPLYIAIVSLARELILNIERASELHILASSVAILLLAVGVLLIRYGQTKYPSSDTAAREDGPAHRP
ncbi:MAG: phosphate-starvation-inducible protein PsiE [Massilia sp.]